VALILDWQKNSKNILEKGFFYILRGLCQNILMMALLEGLRRFQKPSSRAKIWLGTISHF
jgi:hypothetical protein